MRHAAVSKFCRNGLKLHRHISGVGETCHTAVSKCYRTGFGSWHGVLGPGKMLRTLLLFRAGKGWSCSKRFEFEGWMKSAMRQSW